MFRKILGCLTECAIVKPKYKEKDLNYFMKHFFSSTKKYFKIGIIGAGPSALYCCKYFLKDERIKVDIFDRLPNTYGLIRYGVAPDHINVKNTYKTFNHIFLNNKYRFFGNVHIGIDLKIEELKNYYNVVIFCCGASEVNLPPISYKTKGTTKTNNLVNSSNSSNRTDEILNTTNGIFHARDFIYFYNNYYDELRCQDIDNYLNGYDNFRNVIIIGNGNVSLDLARILTKSYKSLESTDININYLNAIKRHNFKHIYIIGRRTFWEASFTNSELRELLLLDNTKVILNKHNYNLCMHMKSNYENNNIKQRQHKMFLTMVQNYEEIQKHKNIYDQYNIIEFIFNYEIKNIDYINSHLKNVHFELNHKLKSLDFSNNGIIDKSSVINSDSFSTSDDSASTSSDKSDHCKKLFTTPLILFATGFKPNELCTNLYNNSIQMYKNDFLTNKFGIFKGGWFGYGPKGTIANQIMNAQKSTSLIFNFLKGVTTFYDNDITDLLNKKKIQFVSYSDWQYIQNLEKQIGTQQGKVAVKFKTVKEVIQALTEMKKK
ncbi:adrenodoxin reductase, putative [Hepatocystis sp. ex Piliocolobus tephrosceles]|nr:adrenodoxin reductase, putative [Hepatocystis sp. ex Piliocolobus tephrosceles]